MLDARVDLLPDSAANSVAKESELLLLESAEQIKMARVQRAMYQEKVAAAVKDAEGGVLHSERIRSWLTTARTWSCSLQRGAAGYHVHNNSALGVYNLGMVTLNPY